MQAHLRSAASKDIDDALAYYAAEAGAKVANEFIDELQAAVEHLKAHPLTGSFRFAFELELPSLRSWSLQKFPYLIFYEPGDDSIDIWRVLHNRRDVPDFLNGG